MRYQMRAQLFILILFGILLGACAPVIQPASCPPIQHNYPREVVVSISWNGTEPVVTPLEAVVERHGVKVVWVAQGGEIANLKFKYSPGCLPPGNPPQGKARRVEKVIEQNRPGRHAYGFDFYPDGGGAPVQVDPTIIVEH